MTADRLIAEEVTAKLNQKSRMWDYCHYLGIVRFCLQGQDILSGNLPVGVTHRKWTLEGMA